MSQQTKFNTADKIGAVLFALVFLGCIAAAVTYFVIQFSDTNSVIHGYENTDPTNEIESRQALRGQLASLICVILFSTLNSALDRITKIDPSTSTALFGLIFGGTFGFVLDNFIGTDKGWGLSKTVGVGTAWDYAMSTLVTSKFCRFLLTVVFDTMVTVILYKHVIEMVIKFPFFRVVDTSIANFFSSMLISGITFGAYANIMRFSWAYPNVDAHDTSGWISGKLVSLVMTAVCAVFLAVDTKPNLNRNTSETIVDKLLGTPESVTIVNPSSEGSLDINQPSFKVVIVVGTIIALFALSKLEVMDAIPTYNDTVFAEIVLGPGISLEEDTKFSIADDDTNSLTPSDERMDSEITITKDKVRRLLTDTSKLYTYELEIGDYEIVSKYEGNIYKIQKLKERDDTVSTSSVWFGKSVFFLIGLITTIITIFGTAKSSTTTKWKSFAGTFIYILFFTFIPSLFNFKVMA